jgi:DNA-directed RNA polymerase specialized sigma24 family protein
VLRAGRKEDDIMTKNCLPRVQPSLPSAETAARWFDHALRRLIVRRWPPPDASADAVALGWEQFRDDPSRFLSEEYVLLWCRRRAIWLALADRWLRRATPLAADLADGAPDVDEELSVAELRQIVRDCLAALPTRDRALLVGKFLRGRPLRVLARSRFGADDNAAILKVWRRLGNAVRNFCRLLAERGVDGTK